MKPNRHYERRMSAVISLSFLGDYRMGDETASLSCFTRTSFAMTLMVLLFASCNTEEPQQPKQTTTAELKQHLAKANEDLVRVEEMDIENYIKRHKWTMEKLGSGLRYMIYEKGTGKPVELNTIIKYNYTTELLNGVECYSSKELGPKQFLVGKGGVESGLEQAVLQLREGDRAKIILPSHLAFGMVGDDDCIPRKAVVIYDLKVLSVTNRKNLN